MHCKAVWWVDLLGGYEFGAESEDAGVFTVLFPTTMIYRWYARSRAMGEVSSAYRLRRLRRLLFFPSERGFVPVIQNQKCLKVM